MIDNKVICKRYIDNLYLLREAYHSVTLTLELVEENGFDIQSYLDYKAQSQLRAEDKQQMTTNGRKRSRNAKKDKNAKQPKEKTHEVSFLLFKQCHSITEVAKQRELTEDTIIHHLSRYILNGLMSIYDVMSIEELEEVRRVKREHPDIVSISDFKSLIRNNMSYSLLRLAIQYIST